MPDTQPADATTTEAPAATSTEDAGQPAPWGDDFDPERAWKLVENLRADQAKSKAKLAEYDKAAQERADAEKSELERATERATRAEQALADREAAEKRKSVLDKHGLTADDAAFLAGVSDDDLDARAKALAARLGVGQSTKDAAEAIPGKPSPKLTAGHESVEPADAFDPIALADKAHKRLI